MLERILMLKSGERTGVAKGVKWANTCPFFSDKSLLCSAAFVLLLTTSGCAVHLNSSVPFRYIPSLSAGDPIQTRIGVERLKDARPSEDHDTTNEITDIDEKVTAKFLEDLKSSNLASTVSFPPRPERDDLILRGEIKRFGWKAEMNPAVWVPIINLLIYFGLPVYTIDASAALHVQVVDRTGKVVAEYTKHADRSKNYSMYDNVNAGEAGAELADAFRDVVKQVKEALFVDLSQYASTRPAATP
jgi:hypothetical protein